MGMWDSRRCYSSNAGCFRALRHQRNDNHAFGRVKYRVWYRVLRLVYDIIQRLWRNQHDGNE